MTVTTTDMFCGAGGSSLGAVAAGVDLRMALNHWPQAIATHNTNFPHADHDCTDVQSCNPRRYPRTTLLIASPECTNHTVAKGVTRPSRQRDMFTTHPPDPAAERSRATMWDVPRFAEVHRYAAMIIENVVEAAKWELWDAWLGTLTALGYAYQVVYANSMFFAPTPQSRDRLYVVCWRATSRAPDLRLTPRAHCSRCCHDVAAVQAWKKPHARWGRYRTQYVYCCPQCATAVSPYHHCAADAIDWSLPTTRIGDRVRRPLSETTRRRVAIGLATYGAQPTIVDYVHSGHDQSKVRPVTAPLPTQLTSGSQALVAPPFVTSYYGTGGSSPVSAPLPTVTTRDRHALVVPPFVLSAYTRPSGVGAAVSPLSAALPTVPARAVHALVQPASADDVDACGYRMLQPHEVQAAMGFPAAYVVLGTHEQRIKQLGNAVTPPVMTWLVQQVIATLDA